jgi:hypothetical protein
MEGRSTMLAPAAGETLRDYCDGCEALIACRAVAAQAPAFPGRARHPPRRRMGDR